jgi:hypothetical protein
VKGGQFTGAPAPQEAGESIAKNCPADSMPVQQLQVFKINQRIPYKYLWHLNEDSTHTNPQPAVP